MKLNLTTANFTTASTKANQTKPLVRRVGERSYRVASSRGGFYAVTFSVAFDGKFGECSCPAGSRGQLCYHIAAAVSLHVFVMRVARDGGRVAAFASASSCPPPPRHWARGAAKPDTSGIDCGSGDDISHLELARRDGAVRICRQCKEPRGYGDCPCGEELILNLPTPDDREFLGMSVYNQSRFIC